METTLSTKGQIVIPRQIRQSHDWKPGVTFTIIDEGGALILKPSVIKRHTTLESVIGCAGYSGPKLSLGDMDKSVSETAIEQASSWSR